MFTLRENLTKSFGWPTTLKRAFGRLVSAVSVLIVCSAVAHAQDVYITPDLPFVEFDNGREFIVIERDQNPEARIPDFFTMTSRQCPPFCVQPMSGGEGVTTVGELEVLDFMQGAVSDGTGIVVDSRLSEWYQGGTIPGSVNLPFTLFENPDGNPFLIPVLQSLGGIQDSAGTWDFANAKSLLMFCNGQWCGQSHRAIENLLSVGYPPEKLLYYRGGMQGWLTVGLTVEIPS